MLTLYGENDFIWSLTRPKIIVISQLNKFKEDRRCSANLACVLLFIIFCNISFNPDISITILLAISINCWESKIGIKKGMKKGVKKGKNKKEKKSEKGETQRRSKIIKII